MQAGSCRVTNSLLLLLAQALHFLLQEALARMQRGAGGWLAIGQWLMRDHAHFFRTKSNSPGRRGENS
jgi:hypothetical protein